MMVLGHVATGRDNNLNLIRMVAATAVMVSHAVPIALGEGAPEPLADWLGLTLGSVAVFIFFAISGYLITASFNRSSSRTSFVLARLLRLLPGLLVNLLLVAFVLGPLVTTLPVATYLGLPDPYLFVLRDMALVPLQYTLPGVFETQPYPAVVGSIWTLRHEVACYAGVFFAGLMGAWRGPRAAALALSLYVLGWLVLTLGNLSLPQPFGRLPRLAMPFAIGVAFYIWRDRIPLSLWGVALTAGLAWLAAGSILYLPALSLAITYITFWLGYVPGGAIRAYNRLGDYSYGMYIYAFPLQGWAVWAFGDQTPLQNLLYSLPPTLILAVLSWHLVEKPAMEVKGRLLRRPPDRRLA
ncbi:acyltransferase family protein [Pseudoroseicyclus aestuarii]|uniref:Peptidoglycan/LPS O-acetylase OafA/YrhL n=1 Tax=Pseudoroseicyclus aestuarii TaxID=1795041 RepID=A0A318SN38_9RHOB|nr:acyltransferase family protein [Pseudoroseicyclus aestuarii]PYE82223.1 peptidoglycan/LPS O-acetylase OafA/YrhL [Pseudoroseicyclus aestuarii]